MSKETTTSFKKEYLLEGLGCASCASKIETKVCKLTGVNEASLDFANQKLSISLNTQADTSSIDLATRSLIKRIEPDVVVKEEQILPSIKTLFLIGLSCGDCAAKIENRLVKLEGVKRASVDLMGQKLLIEAEDKKTLPALTRQAVSIVKEIEPEVEISFVLPKKQETTTEKKVWVRRVALAIGTVLFIVGLVAQLPQPYVFIVFLLSYLLVGGEVVLRALKNITRGQVFDENFLMSVATIGAFAIGEYPEGVAVMLFYQVGEAFQRMAVARSRRSISSLMDIRPDHANIQTKSGLQSVSPEEVGIGETIVVKPGEKIPLDGIIISGRSTLDTSALTGESIPRDVDTGDEVLSGSINKTGLLTIEVSKEFGESTVSKILDLVQNASSNKSETENFITKFARYYTPVVVFSALALAVLPPLVFGGIWTEWINRALVFLVISCPCALVVSVPLSYFGGIGGASRKGILVKGSNYLEALNKVDTVVFDKTGTLTKGVFKVTEVHPQGSFSKDELLHYAALAESNSNHPIANSILRAYNKKVARTDITSFEEIAGLGLRVITENKHILAGNFKLMTSEGIIAKQTDARGTIVHVAIDGVYAGFIVIADEIKPDSKRAVSELKDIGVRQTVMLTGDSQTVATRTAEQLGLDTFYAELLPQHKVEQLEKLEAQKKDAGALVFVGDGINDAPVLARSDIGVAMGGVGSDAAIEAADVVLMTDEPSKLVTAIKIAKRTRGIAVQNIIFALLVKAVVLVLGALGIADMWMAVFADVGVTILAVFNAMRAMRTPEQKTTVRS